MMIIEKLRYDKTVQKTLKALDQQEKPLLKLLQDWSRINSGSRNFAGLKAMERAVLDFAAPLEASVDFIDLPPSRMLQKDGTMALLENGRSLRLIKRPNAPRRVLLTGHLDTVFPADHPFQMPLMQADGRLNGPGVADMKGGILVMLTALKAFETLPFAQETGFEILLSPDEETGSLGSAALLAESAKRAQIGMTYEPALADGTLAGERKGSGNYSIFVRGRAAHAGRDFASGRNAVVHLAKIIGELAALSGARPGLTVNPAVIDGGIAANIVPDAARCRFNIRLARPEDGHFFKAALADIIERYSAVEGFSLVCEGGLNRPPKAMTPALQRLMDLVTLCGESLGIAVSYQATGGCCEGNNLAAAGLPNIDTLGVRGGLIHSADEFMIPDSLVERAKLSVMILSAFACGAFDKPL